MQALRKPWLRIIVVGFITYFPIAHADYTNESEFANNGSIAQVLESALDQYLMPFEVTQIANSVYNEGANYGAIGQEITSSTPQMDFVSKHISGYCSPNINAEKTNFQCSGQSQNMDAQSAQFLEMGDIRPSILLEPTVYTSQALFYGSQNFIRNITMPFPTQTFSNYISNQATFAKNTNQRVSYANYMASQALLGVARYALDEMYGMRLTGTAIGGNAKSANNGAAQNQSIMAVMENEAIRRFTDPNYVAFLTDPKTDQISLLREIAAMHAFELWMNYQSYRQNERIAAILAASLANTASATISGAAMAASAGAGG